MAFDAGAIKGNMILDLKRWSSGISKVDRDILRTERGVKRAEGSAVNLGIALGAASAAAATFFGFAVKQAADVEETMNLVSVSFGDQTAAVKLWADAFEDATGVASLEAQDMAATFNLMFTQMGLTNEQAVAMSTRLSELIPDFVSLQNVQGGVKAGFDVIRSALAGSAEVLTRYGALLFDDNLKQIALKEGIIDTARAMTINEKVLARYIGLVEFMERSEGDLVATRLSVTNQTRELTTNTDQLTKVIGGALIQDVSKLLVLTNAQIRGLRDWIVENEVNAKSLIRLAAAATVAGIAIGGTALAIKTAQVAVGFLGLATTGLIGLLAALTVATVAWGLSTFNTVNQAKFAFFSFGSVVLQKGAQVLGWLADFTKALGAPEVLVLGLEVAFNDVMATITKGLSGVFLIFERIPLIGEVFEGAMEEMADLMEDFQGKAAATTDTITELVATLDDNPVSKFIRELAQGAADLSKDAIKESAQALIGTFLDAALGGDSDAQAEAIAKRIREQFEAALKDLKVPDSGLVDAAGAALASAGEKLFDSLLPVEGLLTQAEEGIEALKAAGRFDEGIGNILGASFWADLELQSTQAIDELLARLAELGEEGVAVAVGVKEAQAAATQAAVEELLQSLTPGQVALDELTARVTLLQQAGELDDTTRNLLAADFWNQLGAVSTKNIDALVGSIADKGLLEALDKMAQKAEKAAKAAKFAEVEQGIRQISGALGGLGPKYAEAAQAAQVAANVMRIASLVATGGWGAVLEVVGLLISTLGILDDKTEESVSFQEQLFTDLSSTIDSIGRRFTDELVTFIREGELAIEELADFVLDELLRVLIQASIVNPIVSAITSGFAQGGAVQGGKVLGFAAGGVVASPINFPLTGGNRGIAGESGPEAILPLARVPGGDLGVKVADSRGSGVMVEVNIINQTSAAVEVNNDIGADGQAVIELLIKESAIQALGDGSADAVMSRRFGVAPRGR